MSCMTVDAVNDGSDGDEPEGDRGAGRASTSHSRAIFSSHGVT